MCEQLSNCQSCSVSFLSSSQWHSVPGTLGLTSLFVFSVSGDYSRQPTFNSVNIKSSGANVSLAEETAVLINLRFPEGTNFFQCLSSTSARCWCYCYKCLTIFSCCEWMKFVTLFINCRHLLNYAAFFVDIDLMFFLFTEICIYWILVNCVLRFVCYIWRH